MALRLDRAASALLVIDVQTRLAPHVADHEALLARVDALVSAASALGVPRRLTEHCPADLGPVVASLRERFAPSEIFTKTRFGAADHPEFVSMIRATAREQIVVAGMEAHVCVLQSVLGLLAQGYAVVAVADAIGSRVARRLDRTLALERMREGGAVLAATETVLFEWARAGDDPAFKTVLSLVKALPEQR